MTTRANGGNVTQLELLMKRLIEALEGQTPKVLVFDDALAACFDDAGHSVETFDPSGAWSDDGEGVDLVVGAGLLEHLRDDRQVLSQIRDRLTGDGAVIVAVPRAVPGREPPMGLKGEVCLRQYSLQELKSVVLRSGMVETQLLADGPELLVVECHRSQETGADVVVAVADDVAAGRWDEAEATLSSTTAQMQSEELVREYALLVGHVHLARGRLAAALEAFNEAANLAGPSAMPLTAMGAVALSAGDLVAATDLFNAAFELCPTHVAALRGLGFVSESRGDMDAALTSYDMAATQRPGDMEIAEKIVDVALSIGRVAVASHAIDRHTQWSGDRKWAKRMNDRLVPVERSPSRRDTPQVAVGSAE